MIWSALDLRGYSLRATDGTLGKVQDFLFDDQNWAVRYAVVDTGGWLLGRQVLIAPSSLGQPDVDEREIPVALPRQQVKDSPPIDSDRPVSRQMEAKLHQWYGWMPYFGGRANPGGFARGIVPPAEDTEGEESGEASPHLRSMREVEFYRVIALDGDAGFVKEFQVDDDGWRVRYLVVDAGGWITGKSVAISVDWVRDIRWAEGELYVDVVRQQIEGSPDYDPTQGIGREYERRLYGHYGRQVYW